jgi:DNA polymerase-3 subunit gamma/tau
MAKKQIDPLKAKAAKQKKIAIAGGVVLVLLMALELPKIMKAMNGGGASAQPAWRTAAVAGATTAAPPTGLAAPTLAGGNPAVGAAVTPAPAGGLSADVTPTAAVGQLASFGRFSSKDPFESQAPTKTSATPPTPPTPPSGSGSIPGSGSTSGTGSTPGGGATPAAPPATPAAAPTSAVIAVNGVQSVVTVGADFPAVADPTQALFHLKSLSATTAKVTIAGGSYASGAPSITLEVGRAVTLMNTADGTRYTLELFKQGTVPAVSTTGGTATVPPSIATVPSTTTGATTTTKSGG